MFIRKIQDSHPGSLSGPEFQKKTSQVVSKITRTTYQEVTTMKRLVTLAIAALLSAILAAPVLAAGNGTPPAQADQAQGQQNGQNGGNAAVSSPISQTQLDYVHKREEAKKRRDELLKLRQQNIDSMNMGQAPVDKVPAGTPAQ